MIHRIAAAEISGKTALNRRGPSVPARTLVQKRLIPKDSRIFDWGCGFVSDVKFFQEQGFFVRGWDPIHKPKMPTEASHLHFFDWVHCMYVLNVLTEPIQREKLLEDIYNFLPVNAQLSLAVRAKKDLQRVKKRNWKRHNDGWITNSGTFQRGFNYDELCLILRPLYKNIQLISKSSLFVIAQKK